MGVISIRFENNSTAVSVYHPNAPTARDFAMMACRTDRATRDILTAFNGSLWCRYCTTDGRFHYIVSAQNEDVVSCSRVLLKGRR